MKIPNSEIIIERDNSISFEQNGNSFVSVGNSNSEFLSSNFKSSSSDDFSLKEGLILTKDGEITFLRDGSCNIDSLKEYKNFSLSLGIKMEFYDGKPLKQLIQSSEWARKLNDENRLFYRNGRIEIQIQDGIIPLVRGDMVLSIKDSIVSIFEQISNYQEKEIIREEPKAGEIYQHANGKNYKILSIAIDHENPEIRHVIYQEMYGDGRIWSRTIEDFLGKIDRSKYPNHPSNFRFQKLCEGSDENDFRTNNS